MKAIIIPGYPMLNTVELVSECKEHDTSHLVTKADIKSELANVKSELKAQIESTKFDIVKCMFSFFVAIMLALVGLWFRK